MSDKKEPDQNAQAGNEDREQLRSMIDDREREYELQMDVQAQLTRIQEELRDLDSQFGNLIVDKSSSSFPQDQADLLKGLVVLDEELSELEEEVGDDVLKRIGSLYVSVKKNKAKSSLNGPIAGGLKAGLNL